MYFNRELLTAQKGDILVFIDRTEREIEYITPVKFNAGLTDYLSRKTYSVGINTMKERWKVNLEFEGYNIDAIEKNRVMLIFLKEQEECKEKTQCKRSKKKN